MVHVSVVFTLVSVGVVSSTKLYVLKNGYTGAITAENPYTIGTLDLKGAGPQHIIAVKSFTEEQWGAGYCGPKAAVGGHDHSVYLFAGPGCLERGGVETDKQFADPKVMRWNPNTGDDAAYGQFRNFTRDGYQMGPMFSTPVWCPKCGKFYMEADYVWQDHGPQIQYIVEFDPESGVGRALHQFSTGLEKDKTGHYPDGEGYKGYVLDPLSSRLYVRVEVRAYTRDASGRETGCCDRHQMMKIFDLPSLDYSYVQADDVPTRLLWDSKNGEIIGVSGFDLGVVTCSEARCTWTKSSKLAKLQPVWGSPGNITGPDEILTDAGIVFDSNTRQLTVSTSGCYKFDDPSWGCEGNTGTEKFAQYTLPERLLPGADVLEPTFYYEKFTNYNDGNDQDWSGMVLLESTSDAAVLV
eukprot:TRINITY_DN3941_c0_g1_i1.p1 TRINITY_DN3941_c0_g1~~TRINITY_DN3941_c0_g1_i1.p1  ORF type:complete len:410 (+),score=53.82 TRINITY_DN3941_c0_g1_i1:73-1302(+)